MAWTIAWDRLRVSDFMVLTLFIVLAGVFVAAVLRGFEVAPKPWTGIGVS